ncbi:hypothetical protein KQ945_18050 [Bacillus subtilis subsp. subtilis]|nr:hypothetical protein [Bacillus subtilis subsp. subtilis]
MTTPRYLLAPLFAALLLPTVATAAPPAAKAKTAAALPSDPVEDPLMISAGFLNGHPDLRFRMLGMEKMRGNDPTTAFGFFQRAGFYSDKVSQAMVAEMLWNGTGTPVNRALAYAWMDLAAERGYKGFVELRERYWAGLSAAEQAQAVAEGEAIYARFGDAAASPRLNLAMRREQHRMTGSRTGFAGNVKILVPGPNGVVEQIDGTKFYDQRYWDPDKYRQYQDSIWMTPRVGRVDVGTVSTVPVTGDRSTRIPEVPPQVDATEPTTDDLQPDLDGK